MKANAKGFAIRCKLPVNFEKEEPRFEVVSVLTTPRLVGAIKKLLSIDESKSIDLADLAGQICPTSSLDLDDRVQVGSEFPMLRVRQIISL